MSYAAPLWDALVGTARRDAQLFWSYRMRVFSQTLGLFLSLTLFYYVSRLVGPGAFPSSDAYFAYVAVGIVILTVLTATLTALPLTVRQELVAGTFERLVVSPTGAAAGVAAMIVFPLGLALGMGTVELLLAAVAFGLDIHWSTAPLAVPVGLLCALSFVPFAIFMAASVIVVKQVSGGVTFVTTAFAFVGGFFFPVKLLPDWIEWASEVQPFTPSLDLLRHLLVGTPLADPAWQSLLKIGLFALVLLPLSGVVLRHAVQACRRRGTLIEY